MKKYYLFLVLFTVHTTFFAQELKGSYRFNTLYEDESNLQFKEGYAIRVIDTTNTGKVIFRVYPFGNNDLNKKFVEKDSTLLTHSIEKSKFNKYTTQVYSNFKGVRAGFYTIPFKIRIDDFDFEQNINFGMNIGFQFRFNREIKEKWLYEPAIGIGLSTINLNNKNSDVEKDRTASAFSISSGVILHFDKNINLGLFYGLDLLGNNDKETNWKYNKKPWLGIGINIGFSISESKGTELKN
ncbi:hypothetical protein [uncultured Lacinutrix sp.]|uniref:hypothetical protein n=1 Tax=uncultured Lacinutrix sp. TaxID=574032 RepID=UPI00261479C4|nr:hypothetical protein [uncultured Lacinutrix sp.]